MMVVAVMVVMAVPVVMVMVMVMAVVIGLDVLGFRVAVHEGLHDLAQRIFLQRHVGGEKAC